MAEQSSALERQIETEMNADLIRDLTEIADLLLKIHDQLISWKGVISSG